MSDDTDTFLHKVSPVMDQAPAHLVVVCTVLDTKSGDVSHLSRATGRDQVIRLLRVTAQALEDNPPPTRQ